MLGDAKTIINRGVATGRVEAGRLPDLLRRNTCDGFEGLGRMFRPFDELFPPKEVSFLAPPVDELSGR